jgi:hypothetical protein
MKWMLLLVAVALLLWLMLRKQAAPGPAIPVSFARPPVAPGGGIQIDDLFRTGGQKAATAICVSQGGSPETCAAVGKVAGEVAVKANQASIWTVGKVWDGYQWVNDKTVSGIENAGGAVVSITKAAGGGIVSGVKSIAGWFS